MISHLFLHQLERTVSKKSLLESLNTGRRFISLTQTRRCSRTLVFTGNLLNQIKTYLRVIYVILFYPIKLIVLHILYMKSSEKALSRNYNAQELELFCHNRFYGPLVVAYNMNKQPYYLVNFTLQDLMNIEQINRNFQNKSKDNSV